MASANRIRANQENARKSTGPKTVEGKEQSRANSLKHGLTGAGVVLKHDMEADLQRRQAELNEEIEPQGVLERLFVQRMALATVRLEFAQRAEKARLTRRRIRALAAVDLKQIEETNAAWDLFERDARAGMRALGRLVYGCHMLKDKWVELEAQLRAQGYWEPDQLEAALRLSGIEPDESPFENRRALYMRIHNASVRAAVVDAPLAERLEHFGLFAPDEISELLTDIEPADIPAPAVSQGILLESVATEVARLEDRAKSIQENRIEPERALALEATLFEGSLTGMRSARYEVMNDLVLHRNWNALAKLRKLDPALFPSLRTRHPHQEEEPMPSETASPALHVADTFWEPAEALAEPAAAFPEPPDDTPEPCESFWEQAEALAEACEPPVAASEPTPVESSESEAQNEPNEGPSSLLFEQAYVSSREARKPACEPAQLTTALLDPVAHAPHGCTQPASCS